LTKAWITGAGGLIGNYLAQSAPTSAPHLSVRALTRDQLDLLDAGTVSQQFHRDAPAWLSLRCAKQNRGMPEGSSFRLELNVELTARLCELSHQIPCCSSPPTWSSMVARAITTRPPHPILKAYAQTKRPQKKSSLPTPGIPVVRTSLNGGISRAGDRGFNEQLRNAFQAGETLRSLRTNTDHQWQPPSLRGGVGAARAQSPGLYHLAGSERLSRWQIRATTGRALA